MLTIVCFFLTWIPCLLHKSRAQVYWARIENLKHTSDFDVNIQSPASIVDFLVKIPPVRRLTWAACLGSAPLAKTPPWQLRGLTTISPLLNILGRNITASFRKDGLKEWGILLVVCPPSSSGCRQHRPSTLSWRVLQGIDHNNQVLETNTRCIPDNCYGHHGRCPCKNILSGVKFSRLSTKTAYILLFRDIFQCFGVFLVNFLV